MALSSHTPPLVVPDLTARFEELLEIMRTNRPTDDLGIVRRAFELSAQLHQDQKRDSGEPYLVHPLETGILLAGMKLDPVAVSAGLLHDSVEDTSVTVADIKREFGSHVAHIVQGVTKISKLDFANSEERQAENVRKMMLAMVDDIRVVLIKLADRLHNMRTLQHLSAERQEKIARETLEIYAPIAHRLGMGKVRGELEDLGFQYVDPIAYQQVRDAVEEKRRQGEHVLAESEALVRAKMKEAGIECRVDSRVKRLYSIHRKLVKQRIAVDQVYDLFAMRIITQTIPDCWAALGHIHGLWRPVPDRIKDFISMPRPNFYQSLHTSVMAEEGTPLEVQIRTEEMHRVAEWGIAAHWKYKDGPVTAKDEQRLMWLRHMVEMQTDAANAKEFFSDLKVDLVSDEEVYTFSPKGKVVILPKDATPVDFAYMIHTEVGHQCVGARVNGRMVQLKHHLKSGDIVEVITQKGHPPSRDWLGFMKSARARQKLRHWLSLHQKEQAIEIGKRLLEQEARRFRASLKEVGDADYNRAAGEYGLGKGEDLIAGVGYGKFPARQVLNKLIPGITTPGTVAKAVGVLSDAKRALTGSDDAIRVKDHDDLMVYRARCCNPIRGEAIVGYVTRGKGVAVHRKTCPNVSNLMFEAERRITVDWTRETTELPGEYSVKLAIYCDDRPGMLTIISGVISDSKSNIRNVSAHTAHTEATIDVLLDVKNVKQLEGIIKGLRKVPGVHDVQRVTHT